MTLFRDWPSPATIGVSSFCRSALYQPFIEELGMSLQSHVTELARRHKSLEKQIEAEKSHPAQDGLKLVEMKRKKLHLKDEIERLQH